MKMSKDNKPTYYCSPGGLMSQDYLHKLQAIMKAASNVPSLQGQQDSTESSVLIGGDDKLTHPLDIQAAKMYEEDKIESMEAKLKKLNYSLVPPEPIESVVRVLMFGAKKHSIGGWKKYPDPVIYTNAIERHLACIKKGELIDPETGESHYAAILCSGIFLEWHRLNGEKK